MAVSAPPKRKDAPGNPSAAKQSEKKIEDIINRGSSTISAAPAPTEEPDVIKTLTVKMLASQLKVVDDLRAKRPRKPTSPKLGISQQDWVAEAIEEKIKREKKLYNAD